MSFDDRDIAMLKWMGGSALAYAGIENALVKFGVNDARTRFVCLSPWMDVWITANAV
jgi:hypothetical protein